jgi:hypothetical protein
MAVRRPVTLEAVDFDVVGEPAVSRQSTIAVLLIKSCISMLLVLTCDGRIVELDHINMKILATAVVKKCKMCVFTYAYIKATCNVHTREYMRQGSGLYQTRMCSGGPLNENLYLNLSPVFIAVNMSHFFSYKPEEFCCLVQSSSRKRLVPGRQAPLAKIESLYDDVSTCNYLVL